MQRYSRFSLCEEAVTGSQNSKDLVVAHMTPGLSSGSIQSDCLCISVTLPSGKRSIKEEKNMKC